MVIIHTALYISMSISTVSSAVENGTPRVKKTAKYDVLGSSLTQHVEQSEVQILSHTDTDINIKYFLQTKYFCEGGKMNVLQQDFSATRVHSHTKWLKSTLGISISVRINLSIASLTILNIYLCFLIVECVSRNSCEILFAHIDPRE